VERFAVAVHQHKKQVIDIELLLKAGLKIDTITK